jgi:hypothetical protein
MMTNDSPKKDTSFKFYGNISVSAAAAEHGQKAREEFYASTLERD